MVCRARRACEPTMNSERDQIIGEEGSTLRLTTTERRLKPRTSPESQPRLGFTGASKKFCPSSFFPRGSFSVMLPSKYWCTVPLVYEKATFQRTLQAQAVCLSSVRKPSVRPIPEFVLFRDTCPPEKLTGAAIGICDSDCMCARRRP